MTTAYIYDAIRTPRGKGKKNGSLHEITALSLATQQLEALRTATIWTRPKLMMLSLAACTKLKAKALILHALR